MIQELLRFRAFESALPIQIFRIQLCNSINDSCHIHHPPSPQSMGDPVVDAGAVVRARRARGGRVLGTR